MSSGARMRLVLPIVLRFFSIGINWVRYSSWWANITPWQEKQAFKKDI